MYILNHTVICHSMDEVEESKSDFLETITDYIKNNPDVSYEIKLENINKELFVAKYKILGIESQLN